MRLTPSAWSCRSIHSFCSAQPGPRQWCLSPVQFRCRSVGSGICSTSFVLDAGPAAIFPVAVRVRPRAALCRASASRACDEDPGLVRSRRRQCSPGVRNSQWRGWDRWTPFVRWRPASRSCIRPRFERGAPRQAAENQKAKCKTSSASARAAYTWPKGPTMASLAGSLQELIQVNAELTQLAQLLALRQQLLEKRSLDQFLVPALPQKILSQPIPSALATQSLRSTGVTKAIGTPL